MTTSNVKDEIQQYIFQHRTCVDCITTKKNKIITTKNCKIPYDRGCIMWGFNKPITLNQTVFDAHTFCETPLLPFMCCFQDIHIPEGTVYFRLAVTRSTIKKWTSATTTLLFDDDILYHEGLVGYRTIS